MDRSPQSVLALAHHATRTGAPGVLLSLLRWVTEEESVTARRAGTGCGP
ncbi:MAG: hypothetical protein AAGK32_03585 [Actinomycetota bacterium]